MLILGIETSCDETGVAVVEDGTKILSNIVVSSLPLHAKTGGIIPEIAARQQIRYVIPVIQKALIEVGSEKIDAIAVTIGPGLIGSLLVGIETAKTLSYVWNKPIIPVNHLIGHIYANFIRENPKSETRNPKLDAIRYTLYADIEFPALVLIVSGGHTDLVLMKNHDKLNWLGGTRDDAAGEAFDKIARLLGLPYPGGPSIEKASEGGDASRFTFPRPMIDSNDFDFSFSGLKTAVLREIKTIEQLNNQTIVDISASVQQAIVDVLVTKTLKTAQKYKIKSILLSGGVAANQKLRDKLRLDARRYGLDAAIFVPQKSLCTDNAAMIASAAYFDYKPVPWQKITANPDLYFA